MEEFLIEQQPEPARRVEPPSAAPRAVSGTLAAGAKPVVPVAETPALKLEIVEESQQIDLSTATDEQLQDGLRQQQDRSYLMSLLREQENLAQLEELRDRNELEEFIATLEHEKKIRAALRREELDRLWVQVEKRRAEDEQRREWERLVAVKDVATLRLHIESMRTQLVKVRQDRVQLQRRVDQEQVDAESAGPTATLREKVEARTIAANTEFEHTELRLLERLEDRLDALTNQLERLTPEADLRRSSIDFRASKTSTEVPPPEATPVLWPPSVAPRPQAEIGGLVLATKGLARLAFATGGGTPHWNMDWNRGPALVAFGPGYQHSTRSVSFVRTPQGATDWPSSVILAGYRAGVAVLHPQTGDLIATYLLDVRGHHGVSSVALLQPAGMNRTPRVLATHAEAGLIAWDSPSDTPRSWPDGANWSGAMRLLTPLCNGLAVASEDAVWWLDDEGGSPRAVVTGLSAPVTAMTSPLLSPIGDDATESLPVVSFADAAGRLWIADVAGGGGAATLDAPGEKIHAMALVAWRDRTWIAVSARRKSSTYLVLRDPGQKSPDVLFSLPERLHRLLSPEPGRLIGLGERFLMSWSLDAPKAAPAIAPLLRLGPVQDACWLPSP